MMASSAGSQCWYQRWFSVRQCLVSVLVGSGGCAVCANGCYLSGDVDFSTPDHISWVEPEEVPGRHRRRPSTWDMILGKRGRSGQDDLPQDFASKGWFAWPRKDNKSPPGVKDFGSQGGKVPVVGGTSRRGLGALGQAHPKRGAYVINVLGYIIYIG